MDYLTSLDFNYDENIVELDYFPMADTDVIGNLIIEFMDRSRANLMSSGRIDRMQKSHSMYYGKAMYSQRFDDDFTSDEMNGICEVNANYFAPFTNAVVSQLTGMETQINFISSNSNFKSGTNAVLANQIYKSYSTDLNLSEYFVNCAKAAYVYSSGYLFLTHDVNKDVRVEVKTDFDVFLEPDLPDSNFDYFCVSTYVSLNQIIKQFPEFRDAILRNKGKKRFTGPAGETKLSSNMVEVFVFQHDKGGLLENGRQLLVLGDGTVILDTFLPYESLTLVRFSPEDEIGKPYGITPMWQQIADFKILDNLVSVQATNSMLASTNILVGPVGSANKIANLTNARGTLIMEVDTNSNNIFNHFKLADTASEIPNAIKFHLEKIQNNLKISDVSFSRQLRGDQSQDALIFSQNMTLQNQGTVSRRYVELQRKTAEVLIKIARSHSNTERTLKLAGVNAIGVNSFIASRDLSGIDGVIAEQNTSMLGSPQARYQLAQQMLQYGVIQPDNLITFIKTGNVDNMFNLPYTHAMVWTAENERMLAGDNVEPHIDDPHDLHIQNHHMAANKLRIDLTSTNDPNEQMRLNQQMAVIFEHIEKHNQMKMSLQQQMPQQMPPQQGEQMAPQQGQSPQQGPQ